MNHTFGTNAGLKEQHIKNGVTVDQIINAWNVVVTFPNVLFDAVKLPTFSLHEQEMVMQSVASDSSRYRRKLKQIFLNDATYHAC